MDSKEAEPLGRKIAKSAADGNIPAACELLFPVLSARTPFRLLDRIGAQIGKLPFAITDSLLAEIARQNTIGGWPLIGSILAQQLAADIPGALARCRDMIIAADVWHGTDSLGERVLGPALLLDQRSTLTALAPWRADANRWVRRSLGVGIHFWAKRTRGDSRYYPQAKKLLAFLRPMFTEPEMDAAKGVGWALKTFGRYYPEILADWVEQQVARPGRYRTVILRKAVKFLPAAVRRRILRIASR